MVAFFKHFLSTFIPARRAVQVIAKMAAPLFSCRLGYNSHRYGPTNNLFPLFRKVAELTLFKKQIKQPVSTG